MDWMLEIRIIRLFSFYLAIYFLISTYVRMQQYRSVFRLLSRLRSRWPNLTNLVLSHRHIFLTRQTLFPIAMVLVLLLFNLLASRLIWPRADLFAVGDMIHFWIAVPIIIASGIGMIFFDGLGIFRVSHIDEKTLEQYFDQAEFWLRGWRAPVVKVLTLGYINPKQIVDREVRNALESASNLLNNSLRWVSIQTGLRILLGMSIWGSYVLSLFLGG
ncbi:MAG: hypothetical protein ACKO23_02950 [Gemmataceae bacterium]